MTKDWISTVDLTCIYPDATDDEVVETVELAKKYGCAVACIPPLLYQFNTSVQICTVLNFPFGWNHFRLPHNVLDMQKTAEVDVVIPIFEAMNSIKNNNWVYFKTIIGSHRGELSKYILKGIIETGYFTAKQIGDITKILSDAAFDYVKTCTGYGPRGVLISDIEAIRQADPKIKIKASGGIKTIKFAEQLLDAGANRLGIGVRSFKEMIK